MADQFSKMYDVERVGGDQRTRLAEMLRAAGQNQPQGQMVSGWYVAPSWSQNLNTALSGALGTYMGAQLDEERKAKTAEILRQLSQGKEAEPMPAVQNFNNMEQMAEGQTPFPVQAPQNELQRLTQRPQSAEQSQISPSMMPKQEQRYVPLTEEEKIGKVMELAQYNPYAAQIWSAQDTAKQARAMKLEDLAEKRAYEEKRDLREWQQRREDKIFNTNLALGSRQPGAPVAVIDPKSGQEIFVSPSQAYGLRPAKSMQPLSVAQQKEVLEADESAQSSQNVINTLNNALKINPIAYSGIGAKERALIRSNTPLMAESPQANATVQLDNMMTGQALEGLKAAFGGNPTEGERKILLELQASSNKTPQQRQEIIERGIAAAQNRLNFNVQKAEAIRSGSYMRPGYSPITAPQQQTGGMPSQSAIDAEIARRQGR